MHQNASTGSNCLRKKPFKQHEFFTQKKSLHEIKCLKLKTNIPDTRLQMAIWFAMAVLGYCLFYSVIFA